MKQVYEFLIPWLAKACGVQIVVLMTTFFDPAIGAHNFPGDGKSFEIQIDIDTPINETPSLPTVYLLKKSVSGGHWALVQFDQPPLMDENSKYKRAPKYMVQFYNSHLKNSRTARTDAICAGTCMQCGLPSV